MAPISGASQDETARLRSAASIPPEFIELTNIAVANEQSLVQFVRHTVTAARNKAGVAALTTYALAKQLAKQPETAHLAPLVADMRRGRKKSPEAAARKAAKAAEKAAEKAAKAAAKIARTSP